MGTLLRLYAGIAQLVEHNLAKVGVASSNLVSRSRFEKPRRGPRGFSFKRLSFQAEWQSGYAADCKSVDLGSIPGSASIFPRNDFPARMAKLVYAADLKSAGHCDRAGSSPAPGTTSPATLVHDANTALRAGGSSSTARDRRRKCPRNLLEGSGIWYFGGLVGHG